MTTSITLRATKGSELTHNEVDDNFSNLKTTADAAAVLTTNTFSGLQTFSGGITGAANVLSVVNGANAQSAYVYGTFTDASNYERAKLSTTAGSGITLAAETAGTGGDNLDITLTPAGTGRVLFPVGAAATPAIATVTYPTSGFYFQNSTATHVVHVGASTGELRSTYWHSPARLIIGKPTTGQSCSIETLTELLTIAAAATSTTTIQIPAGVLVIGVSVRVTTAVTCTSTFTVGDGTTADKFNTAAVSKAATSTDKGTKAGIVSYAAATSIVITPDTVPSDATGRVRVTIHYIDVTPPTS